MSKNGTVCTARMQDVMKYNGETVLRYRIEYPVFHWPRQAPKRINRYYQQLAQFQRHSIQSELYCQAVRQYRYAIKNDLPMPVYEVQIDFVVTDQTECSASLYMERYEFTGGAHGNTLRTSQTWNVPQAFRLSLGQILRCGDPKHYLLEHIQSQIAKNPDNYFDNGSMLAVKTFNPNQFYCTPQGLVIYYQPYDIAPHSSGVPEFLIPYSESVCDPQQLCAV